SIAGLSFACSLVGMTLLDLSSAVLPGVWLAIGCALAAAAGKGLGMLCGISGPAALAFAGLPPAAVFLWLEGGELLAMATAAFNPGHIAAVEGPDSTSGGAIEAR